MRFVTRNVHDFDLVVEYVASDSLIALFRRFFNRKAEKTATMYQKNLFAQLLNACWEDWHFVAYNDEVFFADYTRNFDARKAEFFEQLGDCEAAFLKRACRYLEDQKYRICE